MPDVFHAYLSYTALTPTVHAPLADNTFDYLPGVEIGIRALNGCSNSAEYARAEMAGYERDKAVNPDLVVAPLNVSNVDGFTVSGQLGQGGREALKTAHIVRCPLEITMRFDPTGIASGSALFEEILSTLEMWKPQKL